jgi:phosphatidate phosphatase APP1
MWLFLKILGILIEKISGSAERQTSHDSKSKQVSKKLKESDTNSTGQKRKIELQTIRLLLIRMIFRKV